MADDTGAIATGEGGINDGANAPDVDQTPVESPVAGGKASDSSGNQVDAAAAGSGGGDAESGGSPAAGDGADADDSDADMGATGDADGAEDATLGTADNPLPKLRRPLSAYFLFAAAKRQEVRASNPGGSLGSEAKLIGALWKSLKPEERAVRGMCGVEAVSAWVVVLVADVRSVHAAHHSLTRSSTRRK